MKAPAFISGWRAFYRRWFGWFPVQLCMVCGKPYWGGWPLFEFSQGKLLNVWQAWMMDFCSGKCANEDAIFGRKLSSQKHGMKEGEKCNRMGCLGVIFVPRIAEWSDGFQCHTRITKPRCSECGFSPEDKTDA